MQVKNPRKKKRTDTQLTELLGRALLQNALMSCGLEVAYPVRDRGIDMLAYMDTSPTGLCRAIPIQVKAATTERFGVDSKYKKFSELRIVHVWHVRSTPDARFFLTDFRETAHLAKNYQWSNGRWNTSAPSAKLKKKLKRFEVLPGQWMEKLKLLPGGKQQS
ncbi:MAG TPA: hypothetical protein VNU49_01935 [Opitutaceae bacterium]|jgi:hypothetical protein|nr:hypothetical protein [Opitutaceae bacterium]